VTPRCRYVLRLADTNLVLAQRLGEFYAVAVVFGFAYGGVMPLYAILVREYFGERVNLMFVPALNVWLPFSNETSSTKLCVGTSRPLVDVSASKSVMNRKVTASAVRSPTVASSIFDRPYLNVLTNVFERTLS